MTTDSRCILVVDDEPKIVEVVKSYLEKDGFLVYSAHSGGQAMDLLATIKPALVVLDLMLPDTKGEELCQAIRRTSSMPIIMLTAKATEESALTGLNLGADDYITKPFSPRLLVARVRAILRRTKLESPGRYSFSQSELVINTTTYQVEKRGVAINLTPNEFAILSTLAKHPRKVFTREEIISSASGNDYAGYDRVIDTHIKNIRQKIEDDPKHPQLILTVHGVGYRFGGVKDEA